MTGLVATPNPLDFSKYRPGDVLILNAHQILMIKKWSPFGLRLEQKLAEIAGRTGMDVTISRDEANSEWRIEFK